MSKQIRVRKAERLKTILTLVVPDLDKGASYKSPQRKMRIFIDGESIGIFKSGDTIEATVRLRAVIKAEKIFQRSRDCEELDFVQKYIVGQNFIEATFNSGKVRRKKVSFRDGNTMTLLQQQDFWK